MSDEELIKEVTQSVNAKNRDIISDPLHIPTNTKKQPKIIHYPVALVNCGTLDGNIKILDEFCNSLGIPKDTNINPLCYSPKEANYDLKESRHRKLFLDRIARVVSQEENPLENIDDDVEEEEVQTEVDQEDTYFGSKYEELRQLLYNSNDIQGLIESTNLKSDLTDKFGRTFLHIAVEYNHCEMVEFLFNLGFNPNCTEQLVLTPLSIAVIKGHTDLVKVLMQRGADCKYSTPNAYDIAHEIGQNDILYNFEEHMQKSTFDFQKLFAACSLSGSKATVLSSVPEKPEVFAYNRTSVKVPVYGDNGVEKLVRAVKIRSGMYSMFCECPGDLHAMGYAAECLSKVLGESGMHYCLKEKLKRKNGPDTFGSTKFQEGNLQSNEEACTDICLGYGLAVFEEFKHSEYYPTLEETQLAMSGKSLLMDRFKLFIKHLQANVKCKYYLQAVTLFGPWLSLYKRSVRCGYGLGREVAWLIGLLVYGPLQKKNYHAAAFVHCVNLLYAWPRFIRDVVSSYSSVSVVGRKGHNVANDEYVETYLVKPLKMYCTGRTTTNMLKNLSVSSQIIKQVRDAYVEAFERRKNKNRKKVDSLVDQVKVCIFACEHKFYDMSSEDVNIFDSKGITDKVMKKNAVSTVERGQYMLKDMFARKMYTYFEEWRKRLN